MANGYVILKHQVFREISDEEVISFLPTTSGAPKYKIFDIKKEIIPMESIHMLDLAEYRIFQKKFIQEEIIPYLEQHPDYEVMYFGTAPIPLALHLGYSFGSWREVTVFQLQRESGKWEWNDGADSPLSIETTFVKEEFSGPIDVIYKVEVTYNVQDAALRDSVPLPNKIIGLKVPDPGKDVIRNEAQLKAIAHQFSLGIDSVANYLPNADRIHLFPTVPVGLAFLMGTKINPLITKPIVTYQYDVNNTPMYSQALVLQDSDSEEEIITEAAQAEIEALKVNLKSELENKIVPFAQLKAGEKSLRGDRSFGWVKEAIPEGQYPEMERGYWKSMSGMTETILASSTLSLEVEKAGDGFYISEQDQWQINNRFIFNVSRRLKDSSKVLNALRLFIFHEAIHVNQNLTNYTAPNIGRFPRVLEESDYIADVWAMVHEYAFSKTYYPAASATAKETFLKMILLNLNTMLAFDDLDPNTEEMQVRRVNRYLIWLWNYLMIEDRACTTIEHIMEILANKPIIEIRGLDIRAQQQRTIFRFTGYSKAELELGYLAQDGKIKRASNAGGINLEELIKGFRQRDLDMILKPLKAWYHQIRN